MRKNAPQGATTHIVPFLLIFVHLYQLTVYTFFSLYAMEALNFIVQLWLIFF